MLTEETGWAKLPPSCKGNKLGVLIDTFLAEKKQQSKQFNLISKLFPDPLDTSLMLFH